MLLNCILKTEKLFISIFNKVSKINSHYFLILLSVITIFPLIILSFFNNPASDDFDYSYESQVEPFWSLQIRRYFDWSGRYFSNGLISLDPLVYNNYFLFRLIPIVLIFAFIFLISQNHFGQNRYLKINGKDEEQTKVIDSIGYLKLFSTNK